MQLEKHKGDLTNKKFAYKINEYQSNTFNFFQEPKQVDYLSS